MSELKELQSVEARKLRDNDLLFLANLVNRSEAGVDLTLLVSGTLITGTLISGKKYYTLMQDKFSSFSQNSYGSLVKEYFADVCEVYTPQPENAGDENNEIPLNFIHLEEVAMQTGNGGFSSINGALLRLKIEEVDGYIMGASENSK